MTEKLAESWRNLQGIRNWASQLDAHFKHEIRVFYEKKEGTHPLSIDGNTSV